MKKTFALVLGSVAALQGCDLVQESDAVDTEDMRVDVKFTRLDTADKDTLDVRFYKDVDYWYYGANDVLLTEEDTVTIYVNGEPHTPVEVVEETEYDQDIYYRLELPKAQSETTYRVALTRQEHEDAPNTEFTVPEPPPFTTVRNQVIGVDEPLVITWIPDDQVKVRYTNTLNCSGDRSFEFEDKIENNGTFVLDNSGRLNVLPDAERESLECDGVFEFRHYDYIDDVDPQFDYGAIHVKQVQSLTYRVSGSVN